MWRHVYICKEPKNQHLFCELHCKAMVKLDLLLYLKKLNVNFQQKECLLLSHWGKPILPKKRREIQKITCLLWWTYKTERKSENNLYFLPQRSTVNFILKLSSMMDQILLDNNTIVESYQIRTCANPILPPRTEKKKYNSWYIKVTKYVPVLIQYCLQERRRSSGKCW